MPRGRPFKEATKAGERFGFLVALRRSGKTKSRSPMWLYRCDCGLEVVARSNNVRALKKISCGCQSKDGKVKHGLCRRGSQAPEYSNYAAMISRCRNQAQRDYGGRGITVCARWAKSFAYFLADMGPKPSREHTLDRINPNGNYEIGNCRWATKSEQANNKRRTPKYFYEGELLPVSEISARCGVPAKILRPRLYNGWSVERAINQPLEIQDHRRGRSEAARPVAINGV